MIKKVRKAIQVGDKAAAETTFRSATSVIDRIADKRIVHNLDAALRHGKYSDAIFEQTTGQSVDSLWAEYVATIK